MLGACVEKGRGKQDVVRFTGLHPRTSPQDVRYTPCAGSCSVSAVQAPLVVNGGPSPHLHPRSAVQNYHGGQVKSAAEAVGVWSVEARSRAWQESCSLDFSSSNLQEKCAAGEKAMLANLADPGHSLHGFLAPKIFLCVPPPSTFLCQSVHH